MYVCTTDDDYVRDMLRWVVLLNDGVSVYGDDERPGVDPPQAWIRLKRHCLDHGLHITRMWIQFRSHIVEVGPAGAPGYFFIKQAYGIWGEVNSFGAFIAGTVGDDGRVYTTRWKTPELEEMEHGVRDVDPSSPSLILRRD